MTWKLLGYDLTPDLVYLAETMKVEGYWSLKYRNAVIQNKDLIFFEEPEKNSQSIRNTCYGKDSN